jgi:elongator complex protein 3
LSYHQAIREIIEALMIIPSPSREDVNRIKMRVASKYKLDKMPSNPDLVMALEEDEKRLLPVLRRKVTRTISGVAVVAVMTQPHPCPQPEPCAYCPGGPKFGVPQSYTGFEPATMRGLQNRFDPYLQVKSRIEQLQHIGHNVDKIELIIMGGTFPATPLDYQFWVVKRCLDAINGVNSESLEDAMKKAEKSRIRNVGITVETRPDWAKEKHVDIMLGMGVTRVELGVQIPKDEIYSFVGRSHTVADVVEATRIMKDAGLKIVYHMMPGLPKSNFRTDLEAFSEIFNNPDFKPDMIKIYPCLVLKGTKAYEWFIKGDYKPYSNEEAANLIVEMKKIVPPWIRIMRVQRDIPAQLIVAGVNRSNLRQIVQNKLKEQGVKCRCIRCREVGHKMAVEGVKPNMENVKILNIRYEASEGEEIFISAEDLINDVLIGYLRLRIPSEKAHRPELRNGKCSIVRELHVYGPLVPVGKHYSKAWQHKGYGGILLNEAERITREEYSLKKILVISALGTKEYYKQFNYHYEGPYMAKNLD